MGYILANILFFGQLRNIPHVGFELYGLGRRTCCIMGPLPGASDYVVGEGGDDKKYGLQTLSVASRIVQPICLRALSGVTVARTWQDM